ncbi:dTDP-4-amino-4,6-dideoxygalactose transaminase [Leeuwenhoekiella aestuarii]|uniref:dTDP-4-amino-4,6-dideoxygalactose transaminase n=1 Tax=Leeuwenhoekiella aestuarii TaxID=2249426 RepID=A0A4Q0NRD1_9FLAO|nr:DegT/DnrJ/EryC1/StrS family aminotransferase [Leeuwenhoekiella aestuarii]RXG13339.1 dTDP-4-amino-4,6-dideoxygalactose transaminase [Leeuwenhoekiella aestuarii]RXG14930.1 dTDP-4-amino-4,6-dideoxygalactose transaminase [Leeuwenhoekiella aestuarii]
MIPFLDIKKLNAPYEKSLKAKFLDFLDNGNYILGDAVESFESQFARFCGTSYCVGTGNGFDALRLIFEAYKINGKLKNGDSVLLAANSYIATVLAVLNAGLKPVFIDIEDATFNIDLYQLQKSETSIKAIVITHLYGLLGPVDEVSAYAKEHNLLFIEDASQAHGAALKSKKSGSFGDAAAFSFYPTKNLGALGDGGAVITSDSNLAAIVKSLRNYGRRTAHTNDYAGFNSRLDSLQALFLNEKLKNLTNENQIRQDIAKRFLSQIKNPLVKLPYWDDAANHVFYLFVILVEDRASFLTHLNSNAIGYSIHYPVPPYQQQALNSYAHLSFPVTEQIANTCVSIPLNPALSESEIVRIIRVLNQYHV